MAISAIRIIHLLEWKNGLIAYQNNHFDVKGGDAFEDAAKSPNIMNGKGRKYDIPQLAILCRSKQRTKQASRERKPFIVLSQMILY